MNLNNVQAQDFSGELRQLNEKIKAATDSEEQHIRGQLLLKKAMIEEAVKREESRAAVLNFGVGLTKILSTTILDGALNFVKGLQSGKDGIDLYGDAAKAGAKATTDGLSMVGDIAGTAGSALSKLPGPIGLVGTALAILGPIVGMVAKAMEIGRAHV